MKRNLLIVLLISSAILLTDLQAIAQVAINTDGSAPNSSAMLDVVSTSKGVLVPRMTFAQRNTISTPATGLLIYQTDNTPGFYYYNGSSWTSIGSSTIESDPIVRAINGIVKSNGTTISAATSGTDYSAGTSALATGILKSTTGTGALSIAVPADFPTLNQNTTGTSSNVTGVVAIANGGTGSATQNFVDLTTVQSVGGAKTWSNLGTFNAGLASTGAAVNLNASSNFATNINTGTSTGAVNIANGTTGGNIISIGNTVLATGITQRVGTGNFNLDGVAGSTYSIGASTTTGTITLGGTAQTGAIGIGTGTGAQILNFGTGGTGIKTINIGGTAANVIGIGNTQIAGSISLGGVMTTGTITIGGTGLHTGTIGIGTGTGVQTLNFGTGGTGVKTINIGTNATPVNLIQIGGAASTTSIGSRKTTIGIAGVTNGTGVRLGNGRVTINKPGAPVTGLTGNTTATVTQILDAGIIGFATNNNRTLTLPSARGATGLVQALPGTPAIGDVFTFELFNTGNGNITVAAGTGITIVNTNLTNSTSGSRIVRCRVTSVTVNLETISVY